MPQGLDSIVRWVHASVHTINQQMTPSLAPVGCCSVSVICTLVWHTASTLRQVTNLHRSTSAVQIWQFVQFTKQARLSPWLWQPCRSLRPWGRSRSISASGSSFTLAACLCQLWILLQTCSPYARVFDHARHCQCPALS